MSGPRGEGGEPGCSVSVWGCSVDGGELLRCLAKHVKPRALERGGGGSGKLTGTNCQNAHVTAHMGGGTVKHEEHSSQGH